MGNGYLMQEKSSRTSLYLEDIRDHHDHPDGYQDAWSHLHLIPYPIFTKEAHNLISDTDGHNWTSRTG